ncbi:MAG: phosphopantetheine-binding protein [Bryobacterales bacterium]|nr:phosphopantetheine-binding protein [Bryobacterales bacterium]
MTERQWKILSLINKVTKKNDTPAADESLFESGLLDSFALPDLVSELEDAFAIKIPDSDLNPRKFDSIERIESYLDQRG